MYELIRNDTVHKVTIWVKYCKENMDNKILDTLVVSEHPHKLINRYIKSCRDLQ